MIYSSEERGRRWSLFVQKQYQEAKEDGKASTYKEFGALLGVSDVTIGKWMKGGFCDDINLWVTLSDFSGVPIGSMRELVYGRPEEEAKGETDLGELRALTYLRSVPINKLPLILKICVDRLNSGSVICVEQPTVVKSDTSTSVSVMSHETLSVLIKTAFERKGLTLEQGVAEFLVLCPEEQEGFWRDVLAGVLPPRVQDYAAIAYALTVITGYEWTATMVEQRQAPWCNEHNRGLSGTTSEA